MAAEEVNGLGLIYRGKVAPLCQALPAWRNAERGMPLMQGQTMTISPVGGAIGAEIGSVDLSRDLPDAMVAAIRQALLDHLVVFFRGQNLTSAQYLAFAVRIGVPLRYPFVPGIEGFPEITPVLKRPDQTINFGGVWHSDTTYLPQPPMATLLLARELPAFGGDTEFANQYLAYETLSEGLRSVLSGLRGVARSDKAEASRTREDRAKKAVKFWSRNIQWCGRIPRPAARRCTSTSRTPPTSPA